MSSQPPIICDYGKAPHRSAVWWLLPLVGLISCTIVWLQWSRLFPPPQPARLALACATCIFDASPLQGVYVLSNGPVERFLPPFPPQRKQAWANLCAKIPSISRADPQKWSFDFIAGDHLHIPFPFGSPPLLLRDRVRRMCDVKFCDLDGPSDILLQRLPGDWLWDYHAPVDQRMQAFERILRRDLDPRIAITYQMIERPVIVASGSFSHRQLDAARSPNTLLFTGAENPEAKELGWHQTTGQGAGVLSPLDECTGMPWVDKTTGKWPDFMRLEIKSSARVLVCDGIAAQEQRLRLLLDNLSLQTGLTFTIETRPHGTWIIQRKFGTSTTGP